MKFSGILKLIGGFVLGLTAGAYFTPETQVTTSVSKIVEKPRSTANTGMGQGAAASFAAKSKQLAVLLKEADPCRELKGLLAFADNLDSDDFPKALAQLRSVPETNRDETLDILIGRWMEVDPEGAINSTVQARGMEDRDFGARLIWNIYDAWSEKDADSALDDARHSLSGREQRTAFEVILGNMAKENPAKALEWIKGMQCDSSDYIIPVFEEWAARDAQQAAQAMLQYKDDNSRKSAIAGIAAGLVRNDAKSATAWLNQLPPGKIHDEALKDVANQWSKADPPSAMAWLGSLPSSEMKNSVQNDVALDWAVHDSIGALEHGMKLPDGKEKDSLLHWGLAQLTYDDAQAAARWVENLPSSTMKKNSFATLINQWTDYDPAAAAAYLSAMPDSEMRQNSIETVASSWSYNDPVAAAQWVAALPNGTKKTAAYADIAVNWISNDPVQATAWVGQLPVGPVRDEAAKRVSKTRLVRHDPKGAEKWAESISDPKARQDQIIAVMQQLIVEDPFGDAATEAVKNSSLPDEEKKKLLQKVRKIEWIHTPATKP